MSEEKLLFGYKAKIYSRKCLQAYIWETNRIKKSTTCDLLIKYGFYHVCDVETNIIHIIQFPGIERLLKKEPGFQGIDELIELEEGERILQELSRLDEEHIYGRQRESAARS